ncbi:MULTISPECIES: molecular chaperone [unclassified Mesorhizobium]|uniref:fimbrial biogenesis chaperone n=1 Tax=unclassified Mesorhizobium TaxID=325217 RepID=UPI0003CFA6C6|nr:MULTISPECIES: molecular chaperone [unclassified Mesorhizobium]ESZ61358.1 pilus assembly protein [Mesorhizobium sp. L103C120A0]WJI43467.1 molecular chaperone [Mesorhizobium sp. C120A]
MRSMLSCIGATALLLLCAGTSHAASLRVAPTGLELIAPDSAAVLNLANDDAKRPINVQIRVFAWSQAGGIETLTPTTDVVASPPSTKLGPNAQYVVRVVRVSKAPVRAEESYRVIVDELPDPSRKKAGTVALALRYSVPVFFRDADAAAPAVAWSVSRKGGSLVLTASNTGESRLRLSNLSLTQNGKKLGSRNGLVGYVLGGATMQWPIGSSKSLSAGSVLLKAQSDLGPFDAKVAVKGK